MSNVNNEYERSYIRRAIDSQHERTLLFSEENDCEEEETDYAAAVAYLDKCLEALHPDLHAAMKAIREVTTDG